MNISEAHQSAILHTANAQQVLLENPEARNLPTMSESEIAEEKIEAWVRSCKLVSELEKALCAARRIEHLVRGRREPQ